MSEKSINWERSIELNPGFSVDELKAWFDKYPRSGKRVIAVCQGCDCKDRERDVSFRDYRDLCMSCTTKKCWDNTEFREKVSIKHGEYWDNPESHRKATITLLKRFEDPKEREKQSIGQLRRYADPKERLAHKKLYEDSILIDKITKSVNEFYATMDNPGLQIVNHHIAYDFNNPEDLTVQVTRHFHGQIHNPKGIPVTERGYSLID